MPELPDVEIYRRRLDAQGIGKPVRTLRVPDPRLLKGVSAATVRRHLKDHAIARARRHGKLLFGEIAGDGRHLLMHFGMTGRLVACRDSELPDDAAVVLELDGDRRLAFCSRRTFGRFDLVGDLADYLAEHGLGPDALDVDLARFRARLAGRSGAIKGVLMNQSVLAGIGNVYSDEILLRAAVHPERQTRNLDEDAVADLFHAMQDVLKQAIAAEADPQRMPDSFLLPDRRPGAPCPRCHGTVEKRRVAGRSCYFCPRCQRR